MIFVDWLSVYQDFDDEWLPHLADEVRTYTSFMTGEIIKETTTGYQHEGSYDTSLLIKFNGRRLYMSGNPSAWCRKDNLFGCRSVEDALKVFNDILSGLGYPRFHDDLKEFNNDLLEKTEAIKLQLKDGDHEFPVKPRDIYAKRPYLAKLSNAQVNDGLTFTRIDLTKNFCSDIPALEMLRYLSSFSFRGQCGYLFPNGRTVEWLGSRNGETKGASKRLYIKYYDKNYELESKIKTLKGKVQRFQIKDALSYETLDFLESQYDYVEKLLKFTKENNVVRFELELKAKTLSEHGLHRLKNWSKEQMIIQLEKYLPHIKQVVSFNSKIDLFTQLLALDLPVPVARTCANAGQLWLEGADLNFNRSTILSKSTYYRVRKNLLRLGFDVSSPLNVTNINIGRNVETVLLQSLPVPDWYDVA